MLRIAQRAFGYRPREKIDLVDGKCDLITENQLPRLIFINSVALLSVPAMVAISMSTPDFTPIMAALSSSLPFFVNSTFLVLPGNLIVMSLKLLSDGKSIEYSIVKNETKNAQIDTLKPLKFTPFHSIYYSYGFMVSANEICIIPKTAVIKHRDIIENICKGIEIDLENN